MCIVYCSYTHPLTNAEPPMRTNIEIDDALMAEAQKASGQATKKQTVEEALRLMIRLRRQQEVGAAFGKYRWRGNLAQSRKGRGTR
jgi:Arc/MetJ family transcription regulator